MRYVMNFHNERGFHTHQYAMPTGGPASHGCVRMIDGDARWLYNWADPWVTTAGRGAMGGNIISQGTMLLVLGDGEEPRRAAPRYRHTPDGPCRSWSSSRRPVQREAGHGAAAALRPPAGRRARPLRAPRAILLAGPPPVALPESWPRPNTGGGAGLDARTLPTQRHADPEGRRPPPPRHPRRPRRLGPDRRRRPDLRPEHDHVEDPRRAEPRWRRSPGWPRPAPTSSAWPSRGPRTRMPSRTSSPRARSPRRGHPLQPPVRAPAIEAGIAKVRINPGNIGKRSGSGRCCWRPRRRGSPSGSA
jgi:hypothetical protein